ncbi:hypothetical protein [Treponema zioleckii]|uniref:hypothetical protein n=1 Tax=Treponema zioleckii TaxID=331680 RepID=UPI00168AFA68|nr:hypothetical protein [Treponema zioleckii]
MKNRFLFVLIFFTFSSFFKIFAWTMFPKDEYKNLRLTPEDNYIFTQQENGFSLVIPKADASKISTELPEFPAGIKFISSVPEDFVDDDGERGTILHFWFNFTATGQVRIPEITLQIENHKYQASFPVIEVFENPSLINPILSVEFYDEKENGLEFSKNERGVNCINVQSGKSIKFMVYVQFAVQIYNFDYKIPKNSIFTEMGHWGKISEYDNPGKFSTKKYPVAQFEWKPLVEGTYEMPQVSVNAIAYNGAKKPLSLPYYEIFVSESDICATEEKSSFEENEFLSNAFNSAFEDEKKENLAQNFDFPSENYCASLAQARSEERHSFPWSRSVIAKRQLVESEVGISSPQNEPSIPFLKLLIAVFAGLFVIMIILLFLRHLRSSLVVAVFATACMVLSLRTSLRLLPKYGIFGGTKISLIPEQNSSSVHTVLPGQRVKLLESAGNWIFIECVDYSGWVLKNTVYEIR